MTCKQDMFLEVHHEIDDFHVETNSSYDKVHLLDNYY